jgi:hypothetical protein
MRRHGGHRVLPNRSRSAYLESWTTRNGMFCDLQFREIQKSSCNPRKTPFDVNFVKVKKAVFCLASEEAVIGQLSECQGPVGNVGTRVPVTKWVFLHKVHLQAKDQWHATIAFALIPLCRIRAPDLPLSWARFFQRSSTHVGLGPGLAHLIVCSLWSQDGGCESRR